MYGDRPRSPGRDDRQDGATQPAPWEGHAQARHDDVKVAGAPHNAPPGGQNAGFDDASAYETAAYGAGTPGDNATAAYSDPGGMGDRSDPGPAAGNPYEAGATSAMHLPRADFAPAPDFEDMRRTPRRPVASSNKKFIKFAAVAAAVAVVGGGGVGWAVTSGGSSSKHQATQQPQAQAPAPAPLTDAQRKEADDKRRKELTKSASRAARDQVVRPRLLARGTPPPTKKPTPSSAAAGTAGDPVPASEAQSIARAMLPDFGWSPSTQFGCLVDLWNKESHWNTHASNPSGAYGIPQALPGSKMSSAGPDWQNNASTQIKWGLGYIKDRYSSPCGAWDHSQSTGWY